MIINVLTDKRSWINRYIDVFIDELTKRGNSVNYVHSQSDIIEGDICFLLGFYELAANDVLKKNKHNLVVHASDLPKGKGWAPLTWQILEGKNKIPVCLFEVNEKVDAGDIYLKSFIELSGQELCTEIRFKQAQNAFEMGLCFIDEYPAILSKKIKQTGEDSFYPRRTINSSELDINKSIKEQFNLLRIVDNEDYPAFFMHNNVKYILKIYQNVD